MCKNFIHVFNIEDYLDASHHRSHREMISAEILKGEVKEPYVPRRGARRCISMNAMNRDPESEFQEMLGC